MDERFLKLNDEDYVIAMDTDSIYITFDDLVSQVFPEGHRQEKYVTFLTLSDKTK